MKKNLLFVLFGILLTADLVLIYSGYETLRYLTKPFLIPVLVIYFLLQTRTAPPVIKRYIVFALLFSWVGDILLMLETSNENFFLYGLLAFLVAHLFYINFFIMAADELVPRLKWWLGIPVLVYYTLFMFLLYPELGSMLWPVRIYGLVISFMGVTALNMLFLHNKKAGRWMAAGAVFFILSDSLLAFNKFYRPIDQAGVMVMIAYGAAQCMIVYGSATFLGSTSKQ